MSIPTGTHRLGPADGSLVVRTGRTGAAAKAGHDLLIDVTAWEATFQVGDDIRIELDADGASLRVREGKGGMQALDDDDKASIQATIDDEVLKRQPITFRSTSVTTDGDDRISVAGELTLVGESGSIAFDVMIDAGGALTGSVVVKQSDWGIKPYSTLFGALKVADEVEVVFDASLPAQSR